jgi:hypothetical protein
VALAATVTASGKLLTPFLIFKDKTDGWIAGRELQTYPEECIYACQEKAWMDEAMMNIWIDLVLIPWRNTQDPEVVPLLVLDAYRVHMMGSIVNHIQALGLRCSTSREAALIYVSPWTLELIIPSKKRWLNSGRNGW